jgi:hypothetical protein
MSPSPFTKLPGFIVLAAFATLTGCEQLGIDDPVKVSAAKQAEGRAVGGGCRHSGRALEDCYESNPKVSKAMIFEGWRDMDAYMRENKIETMAPAPVAKEEPEAKVDEGKEAVVDEKAKDEKASKTADKAEKTDKADAEKAAPTAKPQAKGAKHSV